MTSLLTLTLVILYTTVSTEACDPPQDWRPLKPKDVLGNMDLVVLGNFLSLDNTTETTNGKTDYIMTVNYEVDCIMKNKNGVSVGRNIKISETRGELWKNIDSCGDDFSNVRFGNHVAIGIRAHSDESKASEWQFDEYNLQGPYFYWSGVNMVNVDKQTWVCGFQSPVVQTGGRCPDVTLPQGEGCHVPLTPQTAGTGVPTINMALVLFVSSLLISML